MPDICLLNLVVTPAIEDSIIDWLHMRDDISGFSSHKISGHGSSEHAMSLAEQVAGSQRQVLFQTHLPCDDAKAVIESIKVDFKGSGVHYWLLPVLDSGHVA
jgi:hypothetical protein